MNGKLPEDPNVVFATTLSATASALLTMWALGIDLEEVLMFILGAIMVLVILIAVSFLLTITYLAIAFWYNGGSSEK